MYENLPLIVKELLNQDEVLSSEVLPYFSDESYTVTIKPFIQDLLPVLKRRMISNDNFEIKGIRGIVENIEKLNIVNGFVIDISYEHNPFPKFQIFTDLDYKYILGVVFYNQNGKAILTTRQYP